MTPNEMTLITVSNTKICSLLLARDQSLISNSNLKEILPRLTYLNRVIINT